MTWRQLSDINRLLGNIEGASLACPCDVCAYICDAANAISEILDAAMIDEHKEEAY